MNNKISAGHLQAEGNDMLQLYLCLLLQNFTPGTIFIQLEDVRGNRACAQVDGSFTNSVSTSDHRLYKFWSEKGHSNTVHV